MTICVSVKVAEGLVLAADSAVMLTGIVPSPHGPVETIIQNFNFANKVSHFKDYPIGILNWGLGSINARSIQSLIMEFEYTYESKADKGAYTVREVANELLAFIKTRYDAAFPIPQVAAGNPPAPERPVLGFLVGGYSHNEFFADEFAYEFPNSTDWEVVTPDRPDGSPAFGVHWFGMTDALIRLMLGYDPTALEELVKRGVDVNIVGQWMSDGVAALPIVFDGMPLQ